VNEGAVSRPKISVIIPSWRDSASLAQLLPKLAQLDAVAETIVVDASNDGDSEQIALTSGATCLRCEAPNRGAQMNLGARHASGDVLLFQHADTEFTAAHLHAIESCLHDPQIIGGAFYRKYDRRHPRLMWLEGVARWLTRNGGTLFGDQSVFVRRDAFTALNGFATIPLMEDVEFSRRLRAAGKVAVLDPPIGTSARRHDHRGAWRTSVQNGLFIVLFKCGVSPHRLHAWYYRERKERAIEPQPARQLDSVNH
jgi:rSAM/selenodomain-associated transferase 2